MPEISPLIRLFVSSTFADFTFEREVLQRAVFPRLRALCAAQGCRFQPIDLRWGVSEEAGNEKRTLAICLDEIARCQRLSPDLNFLILLGDRYGSCFLPERIPSDQVARLLPHLAPVEHGAFAQAYKEDLNALRPEYVLLPSDGTGDARQAEEPLRAALAQAAQTVGFSERELLPFVASATHLEIQRGLLDARCDPSAAICAIRSFDSMPNGTQAVQYAEQDQGRRAQLEALKAAVEQRLDGHVWRYSASGQIIGPRMGQAIRARYKALAEQFYALLEPHIQKALARRQSAAQIRDSGAEANRQFAASRASVVVGREDALDTVATYLAGQTPLPLVVTGESGVGKSMLLARAVEDAARTHPNAVIVTRYIGVTPGTSSLADLLSGLRREIAERYGQPTPNPLGGLSQLVFDVANQLGSLDASAERPLFLVVDALDQLSAQPHLTGWLPQTLAPHVHVVLSTLSNRQELVHLRAWLPENQVLCLDLLTRTQGADVLRTWLVAEGRRLTSEQENAVLDGFAPAREGGGAPLYLRLAFEQAHRWRSFDHVSPLPPTTTALIQAYFSELEGLGRHGHELVAYALGDIAAAKNGLAEVEVLDVLSRSAAVRDAMQRLSPGSPPIKALRPLPVALWARLAADLERYLTERETDRTRLITFYHRQVQEEAERRYLGEGERATRHAELSMYFGEQRYRLGDGDTGEWNRRKLAELVYQQAKAGPEARAALTTTLTDLRFLEGKVTVEGIAATLDDLALAPEDVDIRKIATAMRAGIVVLSKAPSEVLNQIIGYDGPAARLHDMSVRNAPWFRLRSQSLRGDPALLRILHGHNNHVTNCALSGDGSLVLSASKDRTLRLWDTATGECLRIVRGHIEEVYDCALSANGRVADSTVKVDGRYQLWLWDTRTSRFLSRYWTAPRFALSEDGHFALLGAQREIQLVLIDTETGRNLKVFNTRLPGQELLPRDNVTCTWDLSADGQRIFAGFDDGSLQVWETSTGQRQHVMKGHLHRVTSCAVSAHGLIAVSASKDERNLRVWDISKGQMICILEGHAGNVTGCSLSADGTLALSVSTDGTVRLWDTRDGKLISTLTGHNSSVTCCSLSADGRLAVSGSEDGTLRLWDMTPGEVARSSSGRGGLLEMVTSCALSADGRVALTSSLGQNAPRLWDTASVETVRTLEGHGRVVFGCALSADGRVALTASADRTLRLWETASGQTLHTLKRRRDVVMGRIKLLDRVIGVAQTIRYMRRGREPIGDSAPKWNDMLDQFTISFHLNDLWRLFARMGDTGLVLSCALNADGTKALSAHTDGTLRLWDTVRGRRLSKILARSESLNGCSLNANGNLAFVAATASRRVFDAPQRIILWQTSRPESVWTTGKTTVTSCAVSADGSRALASCADGTLWLWQSTDSANLHVLRGHSGMVNTCALSGDGQLALSASSDQTLRLWDTTTMREVARWTHDCDLRSCALSANGRVAVAGDSLGGIHFFDVMLTAETEEAPSA